MRLNGWHRLGIIATVIWIVTVFWFSNELYWSRADMVYAYCLDVADSDTSKFECGRVRDEAVGAAGPKAWVFGFYTAALAWIVFVVCRALVRWVRRGFQDGSAQP
jgi:hypothetical protein